MACDNGIIRGGGDTAFSAKMNLVSMWLILGAGGSCRGVLVERAAHGGVFPPQVGPAVQDPPGGTPAAQLEVGAGGDQTIGKKDAGRKPASFLC